MRKKELIETKPAKPWEWIAPEYRDENYDGVIMESQKQLDDAKKIRKMLDKELKTGILNNQIDELLKESKGNKNE